MNMSTLEHEITNNDKVLFIHIRKTAGTTLATILQQFFDQKETSPFLRPAELAKIPQYVYDQCHYFRGHIHYDIVCKLLGTEPICLTMLREPTERFISEFAQWQRSSHLPRELTASVSQMTLTEFVNGSELVNRPAFQNHQSRLIGGQFNIESIEKLITVRNIQHHLQPLDIEMAKRRLNEFAFVGLTERFQDSLFLLAYTFGWWPVIDFTSFHIASRRPRQEQVPAETLEKIEALNALDIELYAYAQQLFETRFTQMTYELLERYGLRQHAHLKPPLSSEVMQELLDKHYVQCYTERHRTAQSINLLFDQIIPGAGWHLPIHHPEYGVFRWTGPGPRSTLDLPLATDNDLLIKFSVIKFAFLTTAAPDVLDSLKLSVNNQPILLTKTTTKTGTIVFEGHIPRSVLTTNRGFSRLTFEVSRTVPARTLNPGSNDERLLGLPFNRLEIQPAPAKQEISKPTVADLPPLNHQLTPDNQLFFLHIPKTAGTTLTYILERHFDRKEICPFYYPRELLGVSPEVFDLYRYFRGHLHFEVMRKLLRRTPIFITMLRDPVDRFISHYVYWQQNPEVIGGGEHNIEKLRQMSLAEFAAAADFGLNISSRNQQARLIATTLEAETLETWYDCFRKSIRTQSLDIELGKTRLNEFAVVGLTERFQDSLFLLTYTFGWEPVTDVQNLNVTPNKPKRHEVTPEIRERIAELNALDMELYRHAQQLFATRLAQMTYELLERYGQRAHARLKPPLSSEVLQELLQKHYNRHHSRWSRLRRWFRGK